MPDPRTPEIRAAMAARNAEIYRQVTAPDAKVPEIAAEYKITVTRVWQIVREIRARELQDR